MGKGDRSSSNMQPFSDKSIGHVYCVWMGELAVCVCSDRKRLRFFAAFSLFRILYEAAPSRKEVRLHGDATPRGLRASRLQSHVVRRDRQLEDQNYPALEVSRRDLIRLLHRTAGSRGAFFMFPFRFAPVFSYISILILD